MKPKPLLFFDNGIKSRYATSQRKDGTQNTSHWNSLIEDCLNHIPEIENKYEIIDTHISRLEYIGLGSLRKKLLKDQQLRLQCIFPDPEIFLQKLQQITDSQNHHILIDFIDNEISSVHAKLKKFFFDVIDREALIQKSCQYRQEHPCHPHASVIDRTLTKWEEGLAHGDRGETFIELIEDLAWDTLCRHTWMISDKITKTPFEILCYHELSLTLRLIEKYLDLIDKGINLSGALLFSHFIRLGIPKSFPKSIKEWNGRKKLYDQKSDMLDSEMLEYLFTGYSYNNHRLPILGLTCDRKDLDSRIKRSIEGINFVNEFLEHQAAKIPLTPGILLIIDEKTPKVIEKIDLPLHLKKYQ